MDPKKLIDGIEQLLSYMFGGQPPTWLLPTIAWCIGLGLLLAGIVFVLSLVKKILTEYIQPMRYKPEDIQRRSRRQMFADFIEAEMRRLNTQEAWSDNRFAELEAEVEMEGGRSLFGLLRLRSNGVASLRKEKSISKALEKSTERLVLVEGEPGSGKSVALRHLTQNMSRNANKSKNVKTLIPLYVNLKHLRRAPDQRIDQNLIDEFIHKSLNRINDRDIDDFLSEEYRRGIEEGTWLFLFDSFDEIPDVLSSTESDNTIRDYADAISDFLHGMNNCRGIVASREYKGPRYLGWPKFRILPLALDRKVQLVKRTGLSLESQQLVIDGVSQPATDFKILTGNPMFLNLLCEFMRKKEIAEFPKHTHDIFSDYVWKRLTRDQERLWQRFSKKPEEVREAAEKLAFCMTADTGIGLSPTLEQLSESTKRQSLDLKDDFETFINALEYLKLGRVDVSQLDGYKYFTFAHRRFQEYFATAIVLREPERINISILLSDARWRETSVVILQTQSGEQISNMFVELLRKLNIIHQEFSIKYEYAKTYDQTLELLSYSLGKMARNLFEKPSVSRRKIKSFLDQAELLYRRDDETNDLKTPLDWPTNLYHILSILQDGLSSRYFLIPNELQKTIDSILLFLMQDGSLDDRKWALDVAGSATLAVIERAVDIGFSSPGNWVKNSVFLQVARLREIPGRFSRHIVSNLIETSQYEFLFKRRHEIFAQFARFPEKNYLSMSVLVIWMPIVDFFLTTITVGMIFSSLVATQIDSAAYINQLIMISGILVISGYIIRWHSSLIQKTIGSVLSGFSDNTKRVLSKMSRKTRIRRKTQAQLINKLMPLVFGLILTFFGVLMFAPFAMLQLNTMLFLTRYDVLYVLTKILIVILMQSWIVVAIFEAFRIQRTTPTWQILYFLYPFLFLLSLPFLAMIYFIDQVYIISRLGIIISELKGRSKKGKLIFTLAFESKYLALSMPIFIMVSFLYIPALVVLQGEQGGGVIGILFGGLVVIVGIAEVLVIFYAIFTALVVYIRDMRRVADIRRDLKEIDVIHFVKAIGSLTSKTHRQELIQIIFTKQTLNATNENITRLRNLIAFVQATLDDSYKLEHYEKLNAIDGELVQALGFVDANNFKADNYWSVEQLDLLCKLLEQTQSLLRAKT